MPFNWFKRPKSKDSATEPPSPETPSTKETAAAPGEDSSESPQPAETSASPSATTETNTQPAIAADYLAWAKAAYQNVQQQSAAKAKAKSEPESEPKVVERVEPTEIVESTDPPAVKSEPETEFIVADAPPSESPAPQTAQLIDAPAVKSEPETKPIAADALPSESSAPQTAQSTDPPAVKPEPETKPIATEPPSGSPAPETQDIPKQPAWMQRSEGLERLKETAIDETAEPEPEPLPFDDDFLWSARVLAEQGRSPDEISLEEISWLKRLREGLGKTRRSLINQLLAVVGQGPLNDEAIEEIESLLLQADVGIAATDYIIETLQDRLREETLPPEEAIAYLKEILCSILDDALPDDAQQNLTPQDQQLNIWLMTGVNGAGKTTTVGKLTNMAKQSGYACVIAAADTFRAAAVEQVKVWGERTNTPVIANPGQNTDPAAVVYDAISAAQARNAQLLLVDTAGRLQNKQNLMDELAKIRRIIDKKAPDAAVESLLVLDATLGQNGLRQAEVFAQAANLTGVVLTKLDGTAKGGVALAVSQQLKLPIRFIGAGEGIEDLRPFSSYEFVEALLS
ncbi:MAG: signal recognition particle-docking protein FtsY [Cyanobacteria bacterium P01_G01_bin.54]